jgi:hypothetical protein
MAQWKRPAAESRATAQGLRSPRRMIARGALVLACLGGTGGNPGAPGSGSAALAQPAPVERAPPADAPPISPGQRVQTRWGYVQVVSFDHSSTGPDSVYRVEFAVVNRRREMMELVVRDFIRLVTDGLPRAPVQVCREPPPNALIISPESRFTLQPGSAEDCYAVFRVRGQARVVLVGFETDDAGGRGYLRWPE